MESLRVIKSKERKERCLKMRNGLKRGVQFIKCLQQSCLKYNGKIVDDHLIFHIACLLQKIACHLEMYARKEE